MLSVPLVEIVCQRNPLTELLWLQVTATASVRPFPVIQTTLRKIILLWLGHFYILNYSGEMHSWCSWCEWIYTGDHFSSTNVVQMISHWHTFQLKIMQNEIFQVCLQWWRNWRSSIRIHGITAAPNLISNIVWYLTVCWHLLKEFSKYFYSSLKCQGQAHKELAVLAEALDLMADFRDP